MRIIPIFILKNGITRPIHALLDEGATVTLIKSKIIDELNLKGEQANITLHGIGNDPVYSKLKINLKIEANSIVFMVDNVLIVNKIDLPSQYIDHELVDKCENKTGIRITPYDCTPDMV